MPIRKRAEELWKEIDPGLNAHAKLFLDKILENLKDASKIYSNSYYLILVLAAIYWILLSGSVNEFTFLSIKISDLSILIWVIPTIISFAFYQGTCAFMYEVYLQRVYESYLNVHLKSVREMNLEPLVYPPSFFNFERFLARSITRGRLLAEIFAMAVGLLLFFLPSVIVVACIYGNLKRLNGISEYWHYQSPLDYYGCSASYQDFGSDFFLFYRKRRRELKGFDREERNSRSHLTTH